MKANNNNNFVAYYRVSTTKQGAEGLGMAAQHTSVTKYVERVGGQIVASFEEVQSGKHENTANRVEFAKAIAAAKKAGATLIVAKLDRLSRSVAVIYEIMHAGVKFICADMPGVNELTLGILAVVAENERNLCSSRTRAALAEKKAAGVKLGAAREGARAFTATDAAAARAAHTAKAQNNVANRHAWTFAEGELAKGESLRSVARSLNAEGYKTPRGCEWNAAQVANLRRLMSAAK